METNVLNPLNRFLEILAKLRNPDGGCPWDIKQTFQSLGPLLIEEAYEVVDAIDSGNAALEEELGDMLCVIGLFAQIGIENQSFSFDSVLTAISEKLVRRHPHVFGDTPVSSESEVLENWEKIKQEERASKETSGKKGLLDGIPRSLPALQKAEQMGERASRVGFDWNSKTDVAKKIHEELNEFLDELNKTPEVEDKKAKKIDAKTEEFGDLLFSLVQYGRHLGISCESALQSANDKFHCRFKSLEELAQDKSLKNLTSEQLEKLWQRVKASQLL